MQFSLTGSARGLEDDDLEHLVKILRGSTVTALDLASELNLFKSSFNILLQRQQNQFCGVMCLASPNSVSFRHFQESNQIHPLHIGNTE